MSDIDQAQQSLEQRLKNHPDDVQALTKLIELGIQTHDPQKVLLLAAKLQELKPRSFSPFFYSGIGHMMQKQPEKAGHCFQRALSLESRYAPLHLNLGMCQLQQEQLSQARHSFRTYISLSQDKAEAYTRVAIAFEAQSYGERALAAFQEAAKKDPANPNRWYNLGSMQEKRGLLSEAKLSYLQALQIDANHLQTLNSLGTLELEKGLFVEAEAHLEKMRRHLPIDNPLQSNFLALQNYRSHRSQQEIFEKHATWGKALEKQKKPPYIHLPERFTQNRLKIGYISPDFREQSVAYFISPILEAHKQSSQLDIVCYSRVKKPDALTRKIQNIGHSWKEVTPLNSDALAREIFNDKIQILIDLSGHTSGNSLPCFAKKPAPIQITYLGYPCTTGLQSMDYRLTDLLADPNENAPFYTESLLYLSPCFLTYAPPSRQNIVKPPLEEGIIFSSFNSLKKISDEVLSLWGTLLRELPQARLLFKSPGFDDVDTQKKIQETFKQARVDPDRLHFVGFQTSTEQHLQFYNQTHIALDPFPYNGTTTTLEALWMGTPVITLTGSPHAHRVGCSILSALDLKELIASSPEQYLQVAMNLAQDTQKLRFFHQSLRQRLEDSPLCQPMNFTKQLETLYLSLWKTWLEKANGFVK